MRSDEVATTYVDAITTGDVERVLALFAPDGDVHSPLYGTLPATDFFPAMFEVRDAFDRQARGRDSA